VILLRTQEGGSLVFPSQARAQTRPFAIARTIRNTQRVLVGWHGTEPEANGKTPLLRRLQLGPAGLLRMQPLPFGILMKEVSLSSRSLDSKACHIARGLFQQNRPRLGNPQCSQLKNGLSHRYPGEVTWQINKVFQIYLTLRCKLCIASGNR
jgi:hypothetical protein